MISKQIMNLLNNMDGIIGIKDLDSRHRFANNQGLKVFNYNHVGEIDGLRDNDTVAHSISIHSPHTCTAYADHFVSEDECAFRNKSVCILDAHSYNNRDYFLITKKRPYYDNNTDKIIGVLSHSTEIHNPSLIYIQQLLQNPFIETSEFSKLSIEKYFNITLSTYKLTKTEKLCLHYVAQGKTAKEIAEKLYKSVRTIESHLDNARSKLECSNRSELIAKAITEGIISYNAPTTTDAE